MEYELDYVVRRDDGGLEVEDVYSFKDPTLADAIKAAENHLAGAKAVVHKADAVHLRQGEKIKWAKAI